MENSTSIILSALVTIGGGAVLYLFPKTRKHYWWVLILSVILISIILFRGSPYRIKIERENNQPIEAQKEPVEAQKEPALGITNEGVTLENQVNNSEIESESQNRQQSPTLNSITELDNEVQHDGYLTIKVLENSQPIPFINYYVSCAKTNQQEPNDKKMLFVKILIEDFNGTAFINCKVNNDRWLLDRFKSELKMPNCYLEVNGKIIPDKYIVKTENGESANYKVILKRKN
jgi:hypothetical protein